MHNLIKFGTALGLGAILVLPSLRVHAQNENVDNVRHLTRGQLWAG